MESISKIYFIDNPYPNGHKIETFSWSGRIDEYGFIWFDFHLKPENYYANDDENIEEEDEDLSDRDFKILWENTGMMSFRMISKRRFSMLNLKVSIILKHGQ